MVHWNMTMMYNDQCASVNLPLHSYRPPVLGDTQWSESKQHWWEKPLKIVNKNVEYVDDDSLLSPTQPSATVRGGHPVPGRLCKRELAAKFASQLLNQPVVLVGLGERIPIISNHHIYGLSKLILMLRFKGFWYTCCGQKCLQEKNV